VEIINAKVAVFVGKYGESIGSEALEGCKDYARVSEYVEVTFSELPKDEIIRGRISIIDEEMNDLFSRIEDLRQRKQELLALEHQEC
jgi:uncharacterized protein YciU (UPF0263 family)